MSSIDPIQIFGHIGSPYSRKMVALMRYRQIPYRVTWGDPREALQSLGVAVPKPALLPVLLMPGDDEQPHPQPEALCDSTPLIRRLEHLYSDRSVLPQDPALAFIDYLLEDYADEWVTKFMFHYRWHFAADAGHAGNLLPLGYSVSLPDAMLQQMRTMLSERQIGRLGVVGSSEQTAPVIEASYRRFLQVMDAHLASQPYMLGSRPGSGDFALYGQLTQLVSVDPTPRHIALDLAPRVVAWTSLMEDQSGLDLAGAQWNDPADLPSTLRPLLNEIGRTYVPAQLANEAALQAGQSTWECEIDGRRWAQSAFPYQAKCLGWLREEFARLAKADQQRVLGVLNGTGCEALLDGVV
ncbi:glutathione S-transferase family protein [Microbulbifer agarilyticus]|uniref:glutathione S-transferase family protein n=1 Tax=Microbulbifer agarilyticus TaxID=260552 RepID=UPI001CD4CF97|nr:glutathione S-transferase [Microbulbifer agarilyticus]MCA0893267.1 glutathione S-transferase [Microbulbifer agarilyticus]